MSCKPAKFVPPPVFTSTPLLHDPRISVTGSSALAERQHVSDAFYTFLVCGISPPFPSSPTTFETAVWS
jgi:hypothetical protein